MSGSQKRRRGDVKGSRLAKRAVGRLNTIFMMIPTWRSLIMPTSGISGSNRTQDDAGYVEYDVRYVGSRTILEGFSYMEPQKKKC